MSPREVLAAVEVLGEPEALRIVGGPLEAAPYGRLAALVASAERYINDGVAAVECAAQKG